MSGRVLVLRPEPGASETAARALARGLAPVKAPLFTVRRIPWEAPDPADFDAVLLTSANAARHAGLGLSRFVHLPCHTVGEATAAAAAAVGFIDVRAGPSDGAAVLAAMSGRVLHLCGRDHLQPGHPGVTVEPRLVYAADAVEALPAAAREALAVGAVALVHSPRAGATFAALADAAGVARPDVLVAAISEAAAVSLGTGWAAVAAAARPRDEALLELAAELCQKMARVRSKDGEHRL